MSNERVPMTELVQWKEQLWSQQHKRRTQKNWTPKEESTACHFENALREKIVGQEEAVQALVDLSNVLRRSAYSWPRARLSQRRGKAIFGSKD